MRNLLHSYQRKTSKLVHVERFNVKSPLMCVQLVISCHVNPEWKIFWEMPRSAKSTFPAAAVCSAEPRQSSGLSLVDEASLCVVTECVARGSPWHQSGGIWWNLENRSAGLQRREAFSRRVWNHCKQLFTTQMRAGYTTHWRDYERGVLCFTLLFVLIELSVCWMDTSSDQSHW